MKYLFIAIIALFAFAFIGSLGVEREVGNIQSKVAQDVTAQYYEVSRHGTAIDRCVRAGMVAEAYLQAANSELYARWKEVEKTDCQEAGLYR